MYKKLNILAVFASVLILWAYTTRYTPYVSHRNTSPESEVEKILLDIDNALQDVSVHTAFSNWNAEQKIFTSQQLAFFDDYQKYGVNFFLVDNLELASWSKAGYLPDNLQLLITLHNGYFKTDEGIFAFKSKALNHSKHLIGVKKLTNHDNTYLVTSIDSQFKIPLLNGEDAGLALIKNKTNNYPLTNFIFFIGFLILWLALFKSNDSSSRIKLKYVLLLLGITFYFLPIISPLWLSIIIALPVIEIVSSNRFKLLSIDNIFLRRASIGLIFGLLLILIGILSSQLTYNVHYYNSIITGVFLHPRLIINFIGILLFCFTSTYVVNRISGDLKLASRTDLIAPLSVSLLISVTIYYCFASKLLSPFYVIFSSITLLAYLIFLRKSNLNYAWLLTWIIFLCSYLSVHINYAWTENDTNNLTQQSMHELNDPRHDLFNGSVNRLIEREPNIKSILTTTFPYRIDNSRALEIINNTIIDKGYDDVPPINSIHSFDSHGQNTSVTQSQFSLEFIKSFINSKESHLSFIDNRGQNIGIIKYVEEIYSHPFSPITTLVSYGLPENNYLRSTNIYNPTYKNVEIFSSSSSTLPEKKSMAVDHKIIQIKNGNIQQSLAISLITPTSLMTVFSILMSMSLIILLLIAIINSYSHFLPIKMELLLSGRRSLRYKIQFTLLSSIIGSFLLIAIVTLYNVGSTYQQTHEREIEKSLDAFNFQFSSYPLVGLLYNDDERTKNQISTFEKIHDCTLQFYDNMGNKVNRKSKNEISEKINPKIYWDFKNKERKKAYTREGIISNLFYKKTGYSKVNGSNKQYGIVKLDSASDVSTISAKLSQFASSLINIYIFLFLIAVAVAIALSNSITRPLAAVGENLKKLKLGKKHAPLEWEHNDELGALINNYNLTVDKLEESAKLLAITERESAWREMAKQIAHEIKNPLTPMKLSIQHLKLAASRSDNLDIKTMIDRVSSTLLQQIDSLSEIATEFSSFAHFPKPENQTVILNEVIATTHDLFRKRDDIDINLYVPIDEIYVFADKNFLLRVFNNLLKNAIQSIPIERRGVVDIRLKKSKGLAIIEIEDNGMGIPANMHEKIFTPNFTTKSSGTGLGLAISSNIIESFNGQIYFDTTEGHGTTFFVELPLMLKEDNYKLTERVALG